MFGRKKDDLDYIGYYTKTNDIHNYENNSSVVPSFIWVIVALVLIFFLARELMVMFAVGTFVNEASKMNNQITQTTNQLNQQVIENSKKAQEVMENLRNKVPQQIQNNQVQQRQNIQPREEKKESQIKIEMH